jgi:hypothetical protein
LIDTGKKITANGASQSFFPLSHFFSLSPAYSRFLSLADSLDVAKPFCATHLSMDNLRRVLAWSNFCC